MTQSKFLFKIFVFLFTFLTNFQLYAEDPAHLRVVNYFNSVRTLESEFVQVSTSGEVSTGSFFLKKPGKFRFSYDPPSALEIVSHLQAILIFDPKNNKSGPITYPISMSPFKYLIEENLKVDARFIRQVIVENNTLALELFNGKEGISNLVLVFQEKPLELKGWTLENNFGEKTKISLKNLRVNFYISDQIFKTDKDFANLKE